jgi:formiminoglutamase
MSARPDWLSVTQGEAPLLVSIPHTGTLIPEPIEARPISARRSFTRRSLAR